MASVISGNRIDPGAVAPTVESSSAVRLLPLVLSLTAGSVDVISFLGLGGLFIAHITGNLVILATHMVTGRAAPLGHMLSIPVFVAVLALSRLLAAGLEETPCRSLRPLLALQFVLLAGFTAICVVQRAGLDPASLTTIVAGMLGVSAMAVQNALVQTSLVGVPATTVMTTDITIFVMDIGTILLSDDADKVAFARNRAARTWPPIVGFTAGSSLGALLHAVMGPWSLVLPTAFALLALALGFSVDRATRR